MQCQFRLKRATIVQDSAHDEHLESHTTYTVRDLHGKYALSLLETALTENGFIESSELTLRQDWSGNMFGSRTVQLGHYATQFSCPFSGNYSASQNLTEDLETALSSTRTEFTHMKEGIWHVQVSNVPLKGELPYGLNQIHRGNKQPVASFLRNLAKASDSQRPYIAIAFAKEKHKRLYFEICNGPELSEFLIYIRSRIEVTK